MAKINNANMEFPRWLSMIKSGNIKDVLAETEGKSLGSKDALACVIGISQQAYIAVKEGVPFVSSPMDIQQLTQFFSGLIKFQKSNCQIYFSSMYHIMYFLLEKGYLENLINLLTTVIHIKKKDTDLYQNEGKTLHGPFIFLLRQAILTLVSTNKTSHDQPDLTTCLSMLLEMLMENGILQDGKIFLQIVLQSFSIFSKHSPQKAVNYISNALMAFNEVHKIRDTDSCLSVMFQVYESLFIGQSAVSGPQIALEVVNFYLNEVKLKFAENTRHRECFVLLRNIVQLLKCDCSETELTRKIEANNEILQSFCISSKDTCENTSCLLMVSLLTGRKSIFKSSAMKVPNACVVPFLKMILNMFNVLKGSDANKQSLFLCLSKAVAAFSTPACQSDVELLKSCVPIIVQVEAQILHVVQEICSAEYENWESYITALLVWCINLIQVYHLAELRSEVITIGKPVCNFICSLPAAVFEDLQNQQTTAICFTFLASALATKHLDKALECIVAWILKCPQLSVKIFKLWGDLKHNALCENMDADVDTTVWTILTKRQSDMSKEWGMACNQYVSNLSDAEIANFLLQELKTYFVNKYLRNKPVILATDSILALKTDLLTQAKALVIALDVASATSSFPEQCLNYYNQSKTLIAKLQKQKKQFDSITFNSCMGDLHFARLRCTLKYMRKNCQTDMVKLSVEPQVTELPEDRPDSNDSCYINTVYNKLNLVMHKELMEQMDIAIEHWELSCSKLKQTPDGKYDLIVTLKMLCDAGFMLKLYGDGSKQAKVWCILYNMGVAAQDSNMIVTAVGEMLDTGKEMDPDWIVNAKQMLNKEDLTGKIKQAFLLNSALQCLTNDKINEGLALLKTVEPDAKINQIQFTQFLLVIGEYQKHSDWWKFNYTFTLSPDYQFSFNKALTILLQLAKESKWTTFVEACQIQFQLLRVSHLLGEAKWLLNQPREARSYLKSQVSLAQKLALPLRTAQHLLLLAWVDMNTGVVDDCAVKIDSLEKLLELSSTPVTFGEPLGNKGLLVKPAFLSHPACCHCFHCSTTEYRRLVVETATLRATFSSAFGQVSVALPSFEVAMCGEKGLCNYNTMEILKSRAHMWMCYTDFQSGLGKDAEALTLNEKVLELLSSVHDPNFLQVGFEQKVVLQYKVKPLSRSLYTAGPRSTLEVEKTPPRSQVGVVAKTPENKNIPSMKSPLNAIDNNVPVTPFVRPIRTIKFVSSGEENSPPVTKSKRKTKPTQFATKTPQTTRPTQGTRTPFVIVDDDGNPAAVSSSKRNVGVKKPLKSTIKSSESNKKELFPSHSSADCPLLDLASCLDKEEDNILKKSNRTSALRTYGKTKLHMKTDSKLNNISKVSQNRILDHNENGNAFAFHEMEGVIENLSHAEKDTLLKDSKADCAFLEGMPPGTHTSEISSRRKRQLRSKKI